MYFNELRTNPNNYLIKIEYYLKDSKSLQMKNDFLSNNSKNNALDSNYNSTHNNNNLGTEINLIENLKELKTQIIKLVNEKKLKNDPVLWSEKLYSMGYDCINYENLQIDNLLGTNVSTNINESNLMLNQKTNDNFRFNYKILDFTVNGFNEPEITMLLFLSENINSIESILTEKFDIGAVCCNPIKNAHKAKSMFFLASRNKKKSEQMFTKLNSTNNTSISKSKSNINLSKKASNDHKKINKGNVILRTDLPDNGEIAQSNKINPNIITYTDDLVIYKADNK